MAAKKQPTTKPVNKAQSDGCIAGMPANFERIIADLRDIEKRCAKASDSPILASARRLKLKEIAGECLALLPTVESCWRVVDNMIQADMGVNAPAPKKPADDSELFV